MAVLYTNKAGGNGALVVLLHGIMRTSASMAGLEKFLQQHNFATLNIDYPSRKFSIEFLADHVHEKIIKTSLSGGEMHFVGYSMGGLIIRSYIAKYRPQNLGKVVMLGTPNHGSKVADFWQNNLFYKKIFGPAGQQLITDQTNFKHIFGDEVNYQLGIIAGSSTIDPFSSYILVEEGDGRVSINSTKLSGMQDHIVLPVSHFFMPHSQECWRQVLAFLLYGKFSSY